jgi:indole-3-glycerol phosphate synthase
MTILDEIIAKNRVALEQEKLRVPVAKVIAAAEVAPSRPSFRAAFAEPEKVRIIAELKKASPSKGLIRPDFDPDFLSKSLENGGAAALSVLTEGFYFKGCPENLRIAAGNTNLPLLRKDFIFDEYQIYEAKAWGASAILLIAAALPQSELQKLHSIATELGLDVLCEAHTHDEVLMLLDVGAEIIGINSRDLKTFKTDLKVAEKMIQTIPGSHIKIAESGINTADDIKNLLKIGASGFLIGESIMREDDPGEALAKLIEEARS